MRITGFQTQQIPDSMAFRIERDAKVYRAKKIVPITNIVAENGTAPDHADRSPPPIKALGDGDALEVGAVGTDVADTFAVVEFCCCKAVGSCGQSKQL